MTAGSAARKPLMAGNWKMHNTHFEGLALVQKLAFSLTDADFNAVDVAVLPPFTGLRSVQTLVAGDKLRIVYGAQDISPHDKGAYTGDVSGLMLAKLGCSYVLAGHSERRQYHCEDDALVNAKCSAALRVGLTPILCIGENSVRRSPPTSDRADCCQPSAALASPSLRDRLHVSEWRRWINMSGLTGRAIPAGGTAAARQPARVCCHRRSRSQTRSIARRHACERNLCRGERRWRTNPW